MQLFLNVSSAFVVNFSFPTVSWFIYATVCTTPNVQAHWEVIELGKSHFARRLNGLFQKHVILGTLDKVRI